MLERIQLLRNVGQFDSVNGMPGNLPKPTLLYAENGRSKTTRAEFEQLLVEGCFTLRQLVKPSLSADAWAQSKPLVPVLSSSIVVRDARYENGATIVRGETRSIDGALVVGDICAIERDRPFGNLRDSDMAQATFTFSDANYGKRHGQPYPLQNFCVVFTSEIAERST